MMDVMEEKSWAFLKETQLQMKDQDDAEESKEMFK